MSTLILDECLQNLFYAQEAMKEWIPMTEYEVIFEAAENQETADKLAKNEETATKSVGFVRRAIDAVINMIKKLVAQIKDFVARLTMSGEERAAFDKFKQMMEEDPALKNKKVSVADFRKISSQYDELLNKIENEMRAVKANDEHSIDGIVKQVTDFTKNTASAATTIVAADTALKMADSNVTMAKALSKALSSETGLMEHLSKTLGTKDSVKFKKEIDAAAKNTILHRLKVTLFRHKYDSLKECVNGTFDAFTKLGWDSATMAKRALNNEYTGTAIKTTAKTVLKGEAELAKRDVSKKVKGMKNTVKSKFQKKPDKTGVNKPVGKFIFGK